MVDLRPDAAGARKDRSLLLGRAQTLERMGLADRVGPAIWTLAADIEPTLRDLGDRGDIIKTMHRAMTGHGLTIDPERIALHGRTGGEHVIGRLVERGLHDELTGEAYAIVDGLDGRTHHLRFPDIERTTDASPGAIVEASGALRHAAGNFYVNDKPTGAVVGQQPFGGSRASGTNDKAGSILNLHRWMSPRTIKETFVPLRDYRYPFLNES